MHVFVTGAAGFVGKHLVWQLVRAGYRVTCLVHAPSTSLKDLSALKAMPVRIVEGDILAPVPELVALMTGCDRVVHLAAIYDFAADRKRMWEVNVKGAEHVMMAAMLLNMRAVHLSSVAAFGRQDAFFTEEAPWGPIMSFYGKTKREADERIMHLCREHGLQVVTLHPAPVLGSGDVKESGRYIEAVIDRPFPMGRGFPSLVFRQKSLTWVHVLDVVDAIIGALTHSGIEGGHFLVGSHVHTFEEINNMIARIHLGRQTFPRTYWMPSWFVFLFAWAISTLGKLFGFRPPWGVCVDQIRVMLHGYRFHGDKALHYLIGRESYRPVSGALQDYFAHRQRSA